MTFSPRRSVRRSGGRSRSASVRRSSRPLSLWSRRCRTRPCGSRRTSVNFNKVEFVLSAASREGFLRDGLPQLAFAGRSNVGKS